MSEKLGVASLRVSTRESSADMAHAALAPLIGPQFDKFLYAPIRADRNGAPLTVLSALARADVDPWQEAVSLGLMHRDAAAARLTALIGALPGEQNGDVSASSIAKLVTLLPKATSFTVSSPDSVLAAVGLVNLAKKTVKPRRGPTPLAVEPALAFGASTLVAARRCSNIRKLRERTHGPIQPLSELDSAPRSLPGA
jgi:hypothetical protein